jgi:hypothetical protein
MAHRPGSGKPITPGWQPRAGDPRLATQGLQPRDCNPGTATQARTGPQGLHLEGN